MSLDRFTLSIIAPLGISFYTFSALTYTIDLYRGAKVFENSLLKFAVFIAFSPKLIAGPITRASAFLPQFNDKHPITFNNFLIGLYQIIWGFFLKSALADSLAPVVDSCFDTPIVHKSLSLLIGSLFYTFQIYGDFAGYSLIAIGISKMMGFELAKNFDRPYFSAYFSEFWKRWHISLSTSFRDYVYFPLVT